MYEYYVTCGEKASSSPSSRKAGPSSRREWTLKTGTARSSDCETKDLDKIVILQKLMINFTPEVVPNCRCQSSLQAVQALLPGTDWSGQVEVAPGSAHPPCKGPPPKYWDCML